MDDEVRMIGEELNEADLLSSKRKDGKKGTYRCPTVPVAPKIPTLICGREVEEDMACSCKRGVVYSQRWPFWRKSKSEFGRSHVIRVQRSLET